MSALREQPREKERERERKRKRKRKKEKKRERERKRKKGKREREKERQKESKNGLLKKRQLDQAKFDHLNVNFKWLKKLNNNKDEMKKRK